MKDKLFLLLVSAIVVLPLVSCGLQGRSTPTPVWIGGPEGVALVPYTNFYLGYESLVPEGWVPVEEGTFLSAHPGEAPAYLLIQFITEGDRPDKAYDWLLPLLGLESMPEPVDSRETTNAQWDIHTYVAEEAPLGFDYGSIATAITGEGVYLIVLASLAPADELHQELFNNLVDHFKPLIEPVSSYAQYMKWPKIASIEEIGNESDESVEFTLSDCTLLRVYGIGEGSESGMVDYGYIEDRASGQIVWQMYYFETDSAGYFRNRRIDRFLTLPAGDYRLHFQTNEEHAFDEWGERPPGHRFWGISIFEDKSPKSAPAVCWERANSPEALGWSSEKLEGLIPRLEQIYASALIVVTDNQVVFEWGNTTNNFFTHSVRKSLMSALYGVYKAEGVIDISKSLEKLGIDDITPLTVAEKQATVADLLKARSGIYIPAAGETAGMAADRPERGSHAPNEYWYYNNWDFNALGTIFDQETGENIYQAFQNRIAKPTGMQDFNPERLRYTYAFWLSQHPYYGIRISARDLARLGVLFLQNGNWQGKEVIPADWIEESTRSYSDTHDSGLYSGYGYMWWITTKAVGKIKEGTYTAAGYGGHMMTVVPDLDTVIVLRFNTDDPHFNAMMGELNSDLVIYAILNKGRLEK